MNTLPYLTADLPGIGGTIKQRVDDFGVAEIPLAAARGEGSHALFRVVKKGLSTPAAAERIARYMGVLAGQIGYAGLKDTRAVTSQWMSLEGADVRRLAEFRDKQVRIFNIQRDDRKLLAGQLAGNRFTIRIRDVGEGRLAATKRVLEVMVRRGAPNYFGQQRFGTRGDNSILGEALIRGNWEEFVAIYLGRPIPGDPDDCRAAREAFDAGQWDQAMKCWPRQAASQRRALAAFQQRRRPKDAIALVDKRMRRLFISAFQSEIFNEILAKRINTIDRVLAGDWALEHETGRLFRVEDPAVDQPKADSFQISPAGPLPGADSELALGEPGQIEQAVLAARGLDVEIFRTYRPLHIPGARRPLRFRPVDAAAVAGADEYGPYIQVSFTAAAGSYATVLIDEITKNR